MPELFFGRGGSSSACKHSGQNASRTEGSAAPQCGHSVMFRSPRRTLRILCCMVRPHRRENLLQTLEGGPCSIESRWTEPRATSKVLWSFKGSRSVVDRFSLAKSTSTASLFRAGGFPGGGQEASSAWRFVLSSLNGAHAARGAALAAL